MLRNEKSRNTLSKSYKRNVIVRVEKIGTRNVFKINSTGVIKL